GCATSAPGCAAASPTTSPTRASRPRSATSTRATRSAASPPTRTTPCTACGCRRPRCTRPCPGAPRWWWAATGAGSCTSRCAWRSAGATRSTRTATCGWRCSSPPGSRCASADPPTARAAGRGWERDTGCVRGLAMRFLGHSTVRLELAGSVVLTDPVLTARVGPLRRTAPTPDRAHFADVDLVLLSHLHSDHLHLPSLRRLPRTARVVGPRGAGRWLRRRGIRNVDELAPGEELEHGALRVHGVPAAHSGHRFGPRSTRGPQAAAMGHLVEGGGHRVYAAGDTDLFPGMAGFGPLAAALLPVWGWGLSLG